MEALPVLANVPGGGTGTGANVTVTDNGGTVVLANGIVSITINKSNGNVTNFTFNGANLLSGGNGGGSFYFDGSGGPGLASPTYTLTVNPASNGGNQAEILLQTIADPMDMSVYYDLLRGQQGIYDTLILTHQAGYADYPGAELRTNMYVGSAFNWLCVDPYRFRQMAAPSDATTTVAGAPKEVFQFTSGIYSGATECKYAYSDPLGQLDTWGWASTSTVNGVWQTVPSHEYYDGGPMHRELTEHLGNTLLNMFGGGHYGFGSNGDQPPGTFSSKTFGPAFIYANKYTGAASDPTSLKARVLWADAQSQAVAEQSAWPYTWFNPQPVAGMTGSAYAQANGRGTISGTLAINDPNKPGTSPVGLWIGVAPVDGGVDFQQQYLTYQFWVKTGSGGSFSIPNVLPGTYNLWAFGPGVVGTYEKTNVTVGAGQSLNLGTVTWSPLRLGPTVWEIGIPDRNSSEFHNGEHESTPYNGVVPAYAGGAPHNTPTDWGAFLDYANQYPNGVSFVVGTSNYASDWNYCQPTIPNGSGGFTGTTSKIFFNLASAPTASQNARLYIAFASVYSAACILTINGTVQTASVQGSTDGTYSAITNPSTGFFPPNLSFDSIVRLGSQGAWGDAYLDFAGTKLKAGMNEIDISLRPAGGAGNGNGFEYDYVRLELTGYSSSSSPTVTPTKTNTPVPPTLTFTRTNTQTPTVTASLTSTATSSNTASATPTVTRSNTPVPPTFTATFTVTSTNTASSTSTATRTNTSIPPTSTFTSTLIPTKTDTPVPPTSTYTSISTNTMTETSSATRTNTPVPPTATSTSTSTNSPVPATATNTNSPVPPSATPTRTFTETSTNTSTNSPVPPSATFTNTNSPVPPSATPTRTFTTTSSDTSTTTPIPPTATFTNTNSPIPPSATPTRTFTATSTYTSTNSPVPPTATFTNTNSPVPPSATPSPSPTGTSSFTRTNTPTATFTSTNTNTVTASATKTFTSTGTSTTTATWTFTPTGTPTPTSSFTPTAVFTDTPTQTLTVTPTATSAANVQAVLYPNPVPGDSFNIQVTGMTSTDKVDVQIQTTAFRRVNELTFHSQGPGTVTLAIPATDASGAALANGLYYVIVRTQGVRIILKLMVMR